MSDGPTLVTGATGFLGSAFVANLLERGGDDIVALVRAPDDHTAEARMDAALARVFGSLPAPSRRRLRAVAGDLEEPGLGLSPTAADRLSGELGTIVHCGASVRFDLPLADARRVNVAGTRRVLELAERAGARQSSGPPRLVHVSTAFVSGARPGHFGEEELDLDAPFRNTYERTKAEAEALVHASGVPAAIARPSIVVGEASSGWTTAFNVLYWPLRIFARGLLDTFPADPAGVIDAISVDAVAAGLVGLHDDPGARGAHALAAGPSAVTIGELADAAATALDRPRPKFEAIDLVARAGRSAADYLPYFDVRTRFGVTRGHAVLERVGTIVRPVTEVLGPLLAYAAAARWGKVAVSRRRARTMVWAATMPA